MPSHHYSAGDLQAFAEGVLSSSGMAPTDAALVARTVIWADARGIESHGLIRLQQYLDHIKSGEIDPGARPAVERETGAMTVINGHKSAGQVALQLAAEQAHAAALKHGIGWTLAHTTTHTGAIGYFASCLAERGVIGMVLVSGPPLMAYHGARIPSLATSPIAIAVPRKGHPPLLLDMATSVVANGRIKKAAADGEPIPLGWALTREGRPATDARAAAVLLPLGGAKGSGLALMLECLTSVLAGAPILTRMLGPGNQRWHMQNATVVAIDIAQIRPLDDYALDIERLAGVIKGLPKMEGVEEIRLPGERALAEMEVRLRSGIPISTALAKQLRQIGKQHGVPPPQPLDR